MSIDIRTNTELSDVAKLFYGDDFPNIYLSVSDTKFKVTLDGFDYVFCYDSPQYKAIPTLHKINRLSKIAVYDAISAHTGKVMTWGALTGVRPTKLFYECLHAGYTPAQTKQLMHDIYRISNSRIKILDRIVTAQRGKMLFGDEMYNLYVHVPYCTTRCNYCSFVSAPIEKRKEQSIEYVKLLCTEIRATKDVLQASGKKILSVYIGGGTPTAIDDMSFDMLLSEIGDCDCEYTCEAGRPDTVTAQKCDIMKSHGVNRVCVNPQTLNNTTLKVIGRAHTAADFYRAFNIVREYGFDINCDLIAGLYGETSDDFKRSLNGVLSLNPQNFTVHSLSKKNGSAIRYNNENNDCVSEMLDYAFDNAIGYEPYYLYRQKRQAGNLENVGFTLPGKACINNITAMEETTDIIACGAGAISKSVNNGNISRFANMRDIDLYISRFDERLKAKLDFISRK